MKTLGNDFLGGVTHGISDFLRDGSRAFSIITIWMNGFCALYGYEYWRICELTNGRPPKELTIGLVVIVLTYLIGDNALSFGYIKALGGGFETQPESLTDNSTTAAAIGTAVTGQAPVVNNDTPATSQD